jgi:hypothetical protein
MYTEKEINAMINYLETRLRERITREEAMEDLVGAGILDWDGNYTKPYRDMLDDAGIDA